LGNWLKTGVLVAICLITLFIVPAYAQDPCSSPDGYCMDKYGMNNPESYNACVASVISSCEKQKRSQPPPICLDSNGKEISFSRYTPIEDYILLYDLILQGLNERSQEAGRIVVDNYRGTTLYESECGNVWKEYNQIGTELKRWRDTCPDLGEPPSVDKFLEIYSVLNGVCRFASLITVEQSIEETEIVCGTGTVENEYGQCVPERATMTTEMQQKSSNGGGCLIATATFGSELAPQVQMLREIRDNSLLQTQSGQSFMQGFNQFYYSFSPTIADYERENPIFKEVVKHAITPLLASLSLLNYVDLDSEAGVLGYGISLILLNVGMYFVAPVIVIVKLRRSA